jgi:hypothetical protein
LAATSSGAALTRCRIVTRANWVFVEFDENRGGQIGRQIGPQRADGCGHRDLGGLASVGHVDRDGDDGAQRRR